MHYFQTEAKPGFMRLLIIFFIAPSINSFAQTQEIDSLNHLIDKAKTGTARINLINKKTGNGIPQNIVDKIFQPFFITEPTGEGTGLGLSLAYDIINKEYNGTIKVESEEGEGSKFIIILPA